MMSHMTSRCLQWKAALGALVLLSPAFAPAQSDESITELEAFISEETASTAIDDLLPTNRQIDNVVGTGLDITEIPRAVTVLTPETLKQFDVRSFDDLSRVSAGTTRPNIFGLPGSPFIRGELGGVYFNGMLRLFNRNERPTGFGSLEAMNIIKGPAAATLAPTNVGGYADFIPKSPFFDKQRSEFRLTVGSWEHYNMQIDAGGPFLAGEIPAAYRISITGQMSDSFYDNIANDYISIYGSVKARINDRLRIFTGGEYFAFNTNENAGWNRLTQELIDDREYVIGEADPNLVATLFQGTADLFTAYDFIADQNAAASGTYNPDIALVVPADIFLARFPTDPLATGATEVLDPTTGAVFGYKYTPEYFANGHEVFTTKLDPNSVLADPGDFADSTNILYFFDAIYNSSPDLTVTFKSFFDYTDAEKLSSYGFANFSESWKFQQKVQFDYKVNDNLLLSFGGDVQYTDSEWNVDFFVEPFNRRDLSTGEIPPWSIIKSGAAIDTNNDGEWDLDGGDASNFWELATFLQGQWSALDDRLLVVAGGRYQYVDWEWTGFSNFIAGDATDPIYTVDKTTTRGSLSDLYNINANVSYELVSNLRFYAAAQEGTVFVPNQVGGLDAGDQHWREARLVEGGLKASLLDDRLYLSAAVYEWERSFISSTAAGTNANDYEGEGYEFELVFKPTAQLTVLANFGSVEVNAVGSAPFGTVPLSQEGVALYSGAIQYDVLNPPEERYANNPELIIGGYPSETASLFVIYEMENGFSMGAGPEYRSDFWSDIERTLKYPDAVLWNANIGYETDSWEFLLRINNLTDEFYYIGNDGVFGDNTLTTVGKPREIMLSVTRKF